MISISTMFSIVIIVSHCWNRLGQQYKPFVEISLLFIASKLTINSKKFVHCCAILDNTHFNMHNIKEYKTWSHVRLKHLQI